MAAAANQQSTGVLLRHLPAVYQEQPGSLAVFLAACEAILLGGGDSSTGAVRGLEESISRLHTYLDPYQTPSDFLPWLAGWLALSLRADLDQAKQAEVVARIVPMYHWWGTRKGMEEMLALLTDGRPTIVEPEAEALEVGRAIVGRTTRLGRERPHYFQVSVELSGAPDQPTRERIEGLAREIVELAKPAHTYYSLEITTRAPRISGGRRKPSPQEEII
ncbi:putative Phage tail protein domain protein [Candidatus Sulfopaludibacter sp. SbA3]|nr:putative Phage tail protein domain protein [Candidatus Sulfopaludibacter sp. SbA3]